MPGLPFLISHSVYFRGQTLTSKLVVAIGGGRQDSVHYICVSEKQLNFRMFLCCRENLGGPRYCIALAVLCAARANGMALGDLSPNTIVIDRERDTSDIDIVSGQDTSKGTVPRYHAPRHADRQLKTPETKDVPAAGYGVSFPASLGYLVKMQQESADTA